MTNIKLKDSTFIKVPIEFLRWEKNTKKHLRCAFVLSHLLLLHEKYKKLGLYTSDETVKYTGFKEDFIFLMLFQICDTMFYSIDEIKLNNCLKILAEDGLIKYEDKSMITINEKAIKDLITAYSNSNDSTKNFKVYYDCFSYEQEEHSSSNISYLLSFLKEISKKQSVITIEQIQEYFNDIFTLSQIKNMIKFLITDNILLEDDNEYCIDINILNKITKTHHYDRIPHLIEFDKYDFTSSLRHKNSDSSKYRIHIEL